MASEMLQELDLSERSFGQYLLAEHVGDLFDCDAFASLVVRGSTVHEFVSSERRIP
jgi:hypothetical protein